jgi:hypothetical protein
VYFVFGRSDVVIALHPAAFRYSIQRIYKKLTLIFDGSLKNNEKSPVHVIV